jgi:membrane-bound lytic murein transglycosylase A
MRAADSHKPMVGLIMGLAIALFALTAGCQRQLEPGFHPTGPREAARIGRLLAPPVQGMARWEDFGPAIQASLEYVSRKNPTAPALSRPEIVLNWGDLRLSLERLSEMLPELDRRPELLFEQFRWYRLVPEPLLTGYYEPLIEASLEPREGYTHPLYGVPPDLLKVDLGRFHHRWAGQTLLYRIDGGAIRPYWGRGEIDGGSALAGQGLEIAWARDPVDVFFLQIQGSGRLLLPDGSTRAVLYSGKNGLEYVSLGKVLIQRGLLAPEEVSMPAIRAVLDQHPELLPELLGTNPSYIFFRLDEERRPGEGGALVPPGPFGSMNKRLTPWVSVASDQKLFPLGTIAVLDTELPESGGGSAFRGLVFPQDTGGAIAGHRLDLFCGAGERAESVAGHLKANARVHLLVHKDVVPGQGRP